MTTSNEERIIFAEIQKKLFYMIPEKWEEVYLYASIIEEPFKKPFGEMYFYYLPKGILKRKPVNVYQIPGMFNIDEESYNQVIQSLYLEIKKLRIVHREIKKMLWTNITISIKNFQFKIEYGYENLGNNSEFSPYERHIIWRYKNLGIDANSQTREEKEIIDKYLNSELIKFEEENNNYYVENVYKQHVKNIIDYERTLTVEAAIASQALEEHNSKKEKNKKEKEKKGENLFERVAKMKSGKNIDDDMLLNSELMSKRD